MQLNKSREEMNERHVVNMVHHGKSVAAYRSLRYLSLTWSCNLCAESVTRLRT